MNKLFKTLWSESRQTYVVTNETQRTHGKPKTCVLAVAVTLSALLALPAQAYVEKGQVADSPSTMSQAVASWQSKEFKKDWGLTAMKAANAYALGFHGQGVKLGVMDSGALLQSHPDLRGERFHATTAQGTYSRTGNRYPQGAAKQFDATYEKGEPFDVSGDWMVNVNDSHGTHVAGTIAGNRDGSVFHGVAWGAELYSGNTGGTDSSNYGPFLDYEFFYQGWGALVKDGAQVINNSFGTNTRIVPNGKVNGADGFDISDMLPVNTTQETEYEYFLFQKVYDEGKNFVDAAYDAVKNSNTVQVMTTGNRDMKHPYYRALYPYFNPEAESHWIAAAGLQKLSGEGAKAKYGLITKFDEAGNGKWWAVAGTGAHIYSSSVVDGDYFIPGQTDDEGNFVKEGTPLGTPYYSYLTGTSMAAPHITGAMGVILSRYPDMTAIQARTVLFSTANHRNPDGSLMDGWDKNLKEGQVSDRLGWGTPDLSKAMYGPSQLLGTLEYTQNQRKLDVWTNDISQVGWDQRRKEDKEWMAITNNGKDTENAGVIYEAGTEPEKIGGAYLVGNHVTVVGIDDDSIAVSDARKWRAQYYQKRAKAISDRLQKTETGTDGYDGQLIKDGSGTLVLTGHNVYRGGTIVKGGKLLGFIDSFGTSGNDHSNGKVVVENGQFGIITSFVDNVTQTGKHVAHSKADHSVDITVQEDGTYLLVPGQTVQLGNGSLNFVDGQVGIDLMDPAIQQALDAGQTITAKVTAASIKGDYRAMEVDESIKVTISQDGNSLEVSVSK